MEWLHVLPPFDPGEPYPAFPYQGWWPILEERDARTAIRDQVERLGTEVGEEAVRPFYRFLWLLNRGTAHKTSHAYLVFPIHRIDRSRGAHCFRSEVFLFPYKPEGSVLLDGLPAITTMVWLLERRFTGADDEFPSRACSVTLSAIGLRSGSQAQDGFGYAGRILVDAYGESRAAAVRNWQTAIELLDERLDQQPSTLTTQGSTRFS